MSKLANELETERLRLAACGIAAISDTKESAANTRLGRESEYWSGSYDDVCRQIDKLIRFRGWLEFIKKQVNSSNQIMQWAAKQALDGKEPPA